MCPARFFTARVFRGTFKFIITARTLYIGQYVTCVNTERKTREKRKRVNISIEFCVSGINMNIGKERERSKNNIRVISRMVIFKMLWDTERGRKSGNTGWKRLLLRTEGYIDLLLLKSTYILCIHRLACWCLCSGSILWSWFCRRLRLFVLVTILLLLLSFFLFDHLSPRDEQDAILINSNFDFHFLSLPRHSGFNIVDSPFA